MPVKKKQTKSSTTKPKAKKSRSKSKLTKVNEFYCLPCRKKITIPANNICFTITKNKKPMLKGRCAKCGGVANRFVKLSDAKSLKDKFGTC
jgi:hypothetical protein